MSLRVAVLVSGEGSNLQAILDTVHGRELSYPRSIEGVEDRVHAIEHRLMPRAIRIDPSTPRHVLIDEAADGDD